ncbi:MAG: adenylate/guanylate cyclase domain-containing protein [Syntrophomonas sp.]
MHTQTKSDVSTDIKKSRSKVPIAGSKWLIPLFLFLLVEVFVMLGLFSSPEMFLYDSWFKLRGTQNPGNQIVIVAIDEPSISKIGPPPWPRSVHADLIGKLEQAKVIGFDMLFDTSSTPENDKSLAKAIKNNGRVILAAQFSFEKDKQGELVQTLQMPNKKFWPGTAGVGFVNTPTDSDQTVRHMTLVDVNTFSTPFPSLSTAVALAAQGLSPADIKLAPGQITIKKQNIPVDDANRALPNFWGPSATFKTVSYADVLSGKIPVSFFKDKIVLVGPTAAAFHDDWPTPYTTTNMVKTGALPTPGVEIHASTVQSFLNDTWFKKTIIWLNLLFLLLTGFITSLAVGRRGPWKGLIGALLVIAVSCGLVIILWYNRIWFNLAAPQVLIFLTYAVVTATEFIQAEIARRKTKAMFSRYVSSDVVDELMNNPDDVALGGKKQVVTIMFCDIRGFTAYSENKDPQDVIKRLNEYLTAMTNIIFRHGGTLDKYLGDGLMAFFGAPVYYEDHVQRAIKTAIEIQQEVENLNQIWAAQGAIPLKVAVGINTGPAVVGNVGSPDRMDYTLIGEDVNLASRVEALSKLFEVLIVISERAVKVLDAEAKDLLYYLGAEQVKGFTNPIGCYSVKGLDLSFEKSTDKGFK